MRNWTVRYICSVLALWLVCSVGIGVSARPATSLLLAALVIGLANTFVRPILKLLTAPLNCMTFGLFGFVLNAFLFFVVQFVVPGFRVESAGAALIGSLAMGALSSLLNSLLSDKPRAV